MKKRILSAAIAALMMLPLSVTAYAGGGPESDEPIPEQAVAEEIPTTGGLYEAEQEAEAEPNPFTPSGTGTVVDTATDEDGKEFYTITTPSENVFYLIIDRQRSTENVYFLNAVTEADLMALAEFSETATPEPVVETPPPVETVEPEPEPEPEKGGGMGSVLLVLLLLLAGGGAGWYFKIYKPKQQQADTGDDFEYEETELDLYDEGEADPYGDDLYGDDDGDDLYGGDPDSDDDE